LFVLQVKVERVKAACLFQLLPVRDGHLRSLGLNQVLGPKLLEYPVDMNVAGADRICQFNLGGFCRESGTETRKDQMLMEISCGEQIELLRE
jgi:hypothetical protein